MGSLKYFILMLLALGLTYQSALAQKEYFAIKKGNKAFHQQKFTDAEVAYIKAEELQTNNPITAYNKGAAIYEQQRFGDAQTTFEKVVEAIEDIQNKAKAYHNLGNSFLEQDKYEKSIDAFKNALRLNPSDENTRYNLAYAQKMLKTEQQQQQQNQENQENQEEQEDQNDQNENEENQDENSEQEEDKEGDPKDEEEQGNEEDEKEDEGDKDEANEEEKKQPNAPQEVQLTKEEAEQLLRALANEEAKLQEEMQEKEATPVNVKIEKDW